MLPGLANGSESIFIFVVSSKGEAEPMSGVLGVSGISVEGCRNRGENTEEV
jgi:hypothetical protein